MNHLTLGALLLAIPFFSSAPQQNEQGRSVWTIGGTQSCAAWLATPGAETEGRWWIAGFWTGRNMQNGGNGQVGSSTDSEGIIGEIKRICQAEPSLLLINVAARIYVEMDRERR
jgi:hypothetical protein